MTDTTPSKTPPRTETPSGIPLDTQAELRTHLYRALIHATADAVILADAQKKILSWNEAATEMFGHTKEDMHGRPLSYILPERHRAAFIEELEQVASTRHSRIVGSDLDLEGLKKDGSELVIEVSISTLEDGGAIFFGMIVRDVSARKEAKLALKDSEQRWAQLFHQSTDGIVIHDFKGRIIDINDTALAKLGYSRAEALKLAVPELHPPETQTGSKAALKEMASTGAVRFEIDMVRRDGSIFPTEISARTFKTASETLVQGFFRDISERKAAEETLERFVSTLEATTDFVGMADTTGRTLYVNRAGRKMMGIGENEDLGDMPISNFHPPWAAEKLLNEAVPTAIQEGVWSGEAAFKSRDGREIPLWQVLLSHKSPTGEVEFLSTICRDLTDRKRLDEQLRQSQKMEAVGALAGGMAHDFNNLLTVIISYAKFVRGELPNHDPLREDVDEILNAGTRAVGLTRQLLAFSRKQVFRPVSGSLTKIVHDMDRMLRRVIGEDIDIRIESEETISAIKVDIGQIEQVIMNLVVNARDAMPTGGTLIMSTQMKSVSPEETPRQEAVPSGEYVALTVTDSGIGMDAEIMSRVFEPFFTTKEKGKGTGLGLSTAYGIVKQSGGYITVDSTIGKGTTFSILFPPSAEDAERTEPEKAPAVFSGSETVLVVEDEAGVREIARRLLKSAGYAVLTAANAGEALLCIERQKNPIHLMLVDVVMPTMSGPELVARLAREAPDLRALFMSGYTDDKIETHGFSDESLMLLRKPFTREELLSKVRIALDLSKPEPLVAHSEG